MQNRRMPSDVSVRPTTGDDQAHVLRTVREAFSGGVGDGREEVEIVEAVWSLARPVAAGDLVAVRDRFLTRSGRDVDLAIWVRRGDEAARR